MSADWAIRARGLGKAYALYGSASARLKDLVLRGGRNGQQFRALRDVDFEAAPGEAVGIVGRNGSGKSTLLQLLCGTLRPSEGSVEVRGRVAALLELGAGFNPEFTGRENVYLNASVLGLSEAEIAARLPAIEEFAEIGAFIDRPVREYSSGMYARLAFAVNAHVDADILIVDEILSVGDAAFQRKCIRFMNEFRKRGTLLFVSHDEAAVLNLCERAIWLDHGAVQADGPASEVCKLYHGALTQRLPGSSGKADGAAIGGEMIVRDIRWHGHNPIEIFDFDPDAPWHGHGGAVIEHAGLFSPDGQPLDLAQGGDVVELRIACRATQPIERPIVGYILRNRFGVNLSGDNTYTAYRLAPRSVEPGQSFTASFRFQLPYFPEGDYFLAPSIIDGTQAEHYHVFWMEDALRLHVPESPVRLGAVGVPMREIRID